jgi:hypothetical protein
MLTSNYDPLILSFQVARIISLRHNHMLAIVLFANLNEFTFHIFEHLIALAIITSKIMNRTLFDIATDEKFQHFYH